MLAVRRGLVPAPLLAYARLELRRTLRNRRYVVFSIAFPVVLYVLYTAVIPATGPGRLDGLAWPAYFLASMAAYGAMGAAMTQATPIATERRSGWIRQLRVTPLPGPAYVAGKLATATLVTAPAVALVAVSAVVVNGVGVAPGRLAVLVAVLALGSIPFAALGVLLGYLLDAESVQGGMVLSFFALAILGGLFAPLSAFPDAIATIGHMLPSSRLASLGRAILAGRGADTADVGVLAAWALAFAALAAWRYRVDRRAA